MKIIKQKGNYALVLLDATEPSPKGFNWVWAEVDNCNDVLGQLDSGNNASNYTWIPVGKYRRIGDEVGVMTLHDAVKLCGPLENEFGEVSP